MKRTVILGGGFGGLTVARTLHELVPDGHETVVIDASPSFYVGATKTWVMLGEASANTVRRDRKALLPPGVRFVQEEVTSIDPSRGNVRTSGGELEGDFLVIATGAALNMSAVPGLSEAAETFYTMEGAARLRDILQRFDRGHLVVLIPRIPFQCPPAPYEAAMLIDAQLRERGRRDDVPLSVYTIEGAPMATAGPEMGRFITAQLAERNIAFNPLKKTVRVDAATRRVVFEDGTDTSYDLLIAVPPHEAPRVVREAGLAAAGAFVPVDPESLRVKSVADRPVYAIGDVATIPLPGRFKPDMPLVLPKAGTLAEGQGRAVGTQIAAQVRGVDLEPFDGRGYCWIELGRNYAMRGDGEFFAQPHPRMQPGTPSAEAYQDKRTWVERWLSPPSS